MGINEKEQNITARSQPQHAGGDIEILTGENNPSLSAANRASKLVDFTYCIYGLAGYTADGGGELTKQSHES